jgi:hypothetical protein
MGKRLGIRDKNKIRSDANKVAMLRQIIKADRTNPEKSPEVKY